MRSSCLQPIIGSDPHEMESISLTNFGCVPSKIPKNGQTSEVFSDGMFRASVPFNR